MKNYVNENLMPNETITEQAKVSKIIYLLSIAIFVLDLVVSFTAQSVGEFFSNVLYGVLLAILFLLPFLKYLFCELAVTNKKICGKRGVIKTVEMSSPLRQIQDVRVDTGLFGRIFHYGKIKVTTTAGKYEFKYISNANEIKNAVMSQIENTEEDKMDVHAQKIADAIGNKFEV